MPKNEIIKTILLRNNSSVVSVNHLQESQAILPQQVELVDIIFSIIIIMIDLRFIQNEGCASDCPNHDIL